MDGSTGLAGIENMMRRDREERTGSSLVHEAADTLSPDEVTETAMVAGTEYDFSQEPIFSTDDSPVRIDIPGLPESFISVRRSVPYEVSAGRSAFAKQMRSIDRDPKGRHQMGNQMLLSYDIMGLFLYKVEKCVVEFSIKDPRTGKVQRSNGNPKHTVAVFRDIRSEKLCEWVSEKIDETLGWTQEAEDTQKSFSSTP